MAHAFGVAEGTVKERHAAPAAKHGVERAPAKHGSADVGRASEMLG
jgi:anthranilate phosphoribosyltransferase